MSEKAAPESKITTPTTPTPERSVQHNLDSRGKTQVHEPISSPPSPRAQPDEPIGVLEILAASTWGGGRLPRPSSPSVEAVRE